MKALRYALVLALMTVGGSLANAQDSGAVRMHIASAPVADALNQWAEQTGYRVVWSEDVSPRTLVPELDGTFTPQQALERLLKNTHLQAEFPDGHTAVISSVPPRAATEKTGPLHLAASNSDLRLAAAPSSDSAPVDEVLVTAQKREERLQDVPVPVTVLSADTLSDTDQVRLQDYFATVPGLNLSATSYGQGGAQLLAIRGITTGAGTNPTVGVTIDDVPYGSSSLLGQGELLTPDLDPASLERIEVLRGPQGTLYGAESIGGLIKYVTADPSTEKVSGRVQVLGSDVEHGASGYGARGAINVPLSDTLAIRASGFARRDPGYVDNVTTGERDVNEADLWGGLASVLWKPSSAVSLKVNALLQNTNGYGDASIDATADSNGNLHPVLGPQANARLPGSGRYNIRARLYTATLNLDFGDWSFVSISGYGDNRYRQFTDVSSGYNFASVPLYGVSGATSKNFFDTKKFTQELRLSSATGKPLEWLVGAFYSHESTDGDQAALANDATTGAPAGVIEDFHFPTRVTEYALFADLTAHFTRQFDIQFGGRESENRQTYNETDSGPETEAYYGNPSPFVNPTEHTKGNAFTYLVTPEYKLSDELMVYARFTSGYRVGGPNINAVAYGVPASYAPDRTNNYELGLKGDLLDHSLTFDASAYYISWKNVQITLVYPPNGSLYNTNAGGAKSQGVELSLKARPTKGLTFTLAATANDAELTQNIPPTPGNAIGASGDRLPYSSRFSGTFSADQNFFLTDRWTAFVGGSVTYVSAREGEFSNSTSLPRLRFPGYAQTNLRLGVNYDSWTGSLFANNVFDRLGVIGGGISYATAPYYLTYIEPRLVGVSLIKTF